MPDSQTTRCVTCTTPATCRTNGCIEGRPDVCAATPTPELIEMMQEEANTRAPYNPWPYRSAWWHKTNILWARRKARRFA